MPTIIKRLLLSVMLLLAVSIAAARPAKAQFTFSFTSDTMTVSPGNMVTFSGTLTNSGTSTLYFNGDSIQGLDSSISTDDSAFAFDAPLLLAGGNFYTGDLFSVITTSITPGSTYGGTFSIFGGADSNALDYLNTTPFYVIVSTPVPELSTSVSFGTLLLLGGIGLVARKRARRKA